MTSSEVVSTIKSDLKKRGLTQKQLALEAGVSQQWFTKLLSGDTYLPVAWARWFENTLGYNPEFLMKGQGPLRIYSPSFETLCQLVRRLRIVQEVDRRTSVRWEGMKDSGAFSLEEKMKKLADVRKVKAELYELTNKVDMAVGLDDNQLEREIWRQESFM